MSEQEQVLEWLEVNKSVFKKSALCEKIGVDKGNFSKYLKMKSIPEKFIPDIITFITPFGYSPQNSNEASNKTDSTTSSPKIAETHTSYADAQERINRIKVLEGEIAKGAPSSLSLLGKKAYIFDREKELKELLSQL